MRFGSSLLRCPTTMVVEGVFTAQSPSGISVVLSSLSQALHICPLVFGVLLVWHVALLERAASADTLEVGNGSSVSPDSETTEEQGVPQQRFDGQRAYRYLRQLCEFGNRRSGSLGMQKQQELLDKHFRQLGGQVERHQLLSQCASH